MNSPTLIVEWPDPATAVLTLNRPERRNALSIELLESLCQALETLEAEPERRVVILKGAGPAFCAGMDLYEGADPALAERSAAGIARTFELLTNTTLVSIAAAHGAAMAGGAGLLGCCDFVVAADDLRISFPEVRRGLVPALASVALARRLRDHHLRELLVLGETVLAPQAVSMGLVDRMVPDSQLLPEAHRISRAVLQGAPDAVRDTKTLLRELQATDPSRQFRRALEFHTHARLSEEAREGLAAFRERREPDWSRGCHENTAL